MDRAVLASFMDELGKIASNVVAGGQTGTSIGMPPPITEGARVTSTVKPNMKPTNYSIVNTQTRAVATNTAGPSKSIPPPSVGT